MRNKAKTFDCVEMKDRIQAELLAEYESRQSEFSSYAAFIRKTADECQDIREWRATLGRAHAAP